MSAKQDRIYTRTASQLKQEFNFGESFAEVMGIATDARKAAKEAKETAGNPSANLTPEEVFNLLTNNGTNQGIYRGDDGEVYINATYIKSGVLKSPEGDVYFDLDNGIIKTEYAATPYTTRTFAIHSQGMTAYETATDGTEQEVFNTVFNPVGSSAMFGTVITDDAGGGANPRGIAVQGVGGTGVGNTSSDTFVLGKNIYLVNENNSMTNLFTFITQVKEALGL